MLRQATRDEIRQFYHEEFTVGDMPEYLMENMHMREFAFDRSGKGPRDRYYQFTQLRYLERTIRAKAPYAVYTSVALYDKPKKREGWNAAEFVVDVDAKDNPLRTCKCSEGEVCEKCLEEAKELILRISDNIRQLGFDDLHYVYSGRGYHLRCHDKQLQQSDANTRSEVLSYATGAEAPELEGGLQHFTIPFGYSRVYTDWFSYTVNHLQGDKQYPGLSSQMKSELLNSRELVNDGKWGLLRLQVEEDRYDKLLPVMAGIHARLCDVKVSVDTKRLLRLPGTLHYKVSMKCMAVKNIEDFDPLDKAVPEFISQSG